MLLVFASWCTAVWEVGEINSIKSTGGGTSYLSLSQPLARLRKDGKLVDAPAGRRIAFDIGLGHNAPCTQSWIRAYPRVEELHVFSVEGNPYTAWSLRAGANPKLINELSTQAGTFAAPLDFKKINRTLNGLRTHHRQVTLIPAAAGNRNGFVEFQMGDYYNVGTGGLFPFTGGGFRSGNHRLGAKTQIGVAQAPVIRLASILDRIDESASLEVLKIDAQGADWEVVEGVTCHHLRRFKCLLGEFNSGGYVVPDSRLETKDHLLRDAGFVLANGATGSGDQLWLNTAFYDFFATSNDTNLCYTVEMLRGGKKPLANRHLARVIKQMQHKSHLVAASC